MSDLNVTERRIRPIIELVDNRNWKQALQQCDKWQKKGEKSDRFLALKASILVNQLDKAHIEKGKTETLQLCHRNPPITDIEALYQLQGSLRQLSLHHEEGPKLWERAMAARPNDKELLTTLLNGSVRDGNWMSAQKAAMALRKAFPKERQYDFWNMLLCYLISQDRIIPQKDRDLFGRLAYMLMTKAAEAVPISKDEVLTTGKAVATPEESALLIKIYTSTGHIDEALKVLQGEKLGLESRVAQLDPQFAFSLLIEVLNASDDHERVFDVCKKLILSGSSISKQHAKDDRVWKTLQKGASSQEFADACKELAQQVYQSDPKCRAAYLTYFDVVTNPSESVENWDNESLASACVAHYQNFGSKPFCFGDLVRPLQRSKPALESFLSQAEPENGSEIQQALGLKLKHACMGSSGEAENQDNILKLATYVILLHKRLPKEKSECPEMLLLVATCLLRLGLREDNSVYALQANYMLHHCYKEFSEYYPTAIRLIQLCLSQGLVSLAMDRFASLAVKNMQWETVGHLLLTRMSTIHPWPAGNASDSHNPLSALDAGLDMLHAGDRSLDKAINSGLEFGSYSNIIDSVTMKDNMSRSMNRQIFTVEERHIQRIVGMTHDYALDPYPADMVDQRDFSFLPDLGEFNGLSKLEEHLACGPLPKKHWLRAMALQDHIATYLKAELATQAAFATTCLDSLKTALEKTKQQDIAWIIELTEDEISNLQCHQTLAGAILVSKEPPASKQKDFDEHINNLKTWLDNALSAPAKGITSINGIETPTWKFLHASYTTLETLQIISLFLSLQAKRAKSAKAGKATVIAKDKITELQQLVVDAEKSVHGRAQKLKDGVGSSGVLGKLVDAATGRIEDMGEQYRLLGEEFGSLVDEVAVEEYCAQVKDSWEDALNGVLKVKIKVMK